MLPKPTGEMLVPRGMSVPPMSPGKRSRKNCDRLHPRSPDVVYVVTAQVGMERTVALRRSYSVLQNRVTKVERVDPNALRAS
jgi:hypothetical protein